MAGKKKRGLAAASPEVRRMVGQKGGRAKHIRRGPLPGTKRRTKANIELA